MAIFTFPPNPVLNQTYTGPNGVTYTWDSEKWVGAATSFNPAEYLDKTPLAGNEQSIVPGSPTDSGLNIRGTGSQAANLLQLLDSGFGILTVFDEAGRLGIGTADPLFDADIRGDMQLTGQFVANNSAGMPGQVLTSDGTKTYWSNLGAVSLDQVLLNGNTTAQAMSVGDLAVTGDLTVTGTTTILDTEVVRVADNILTLNSNYTGTTPNENVGIEVNRGSLQPKRFYWDEVADKWTTGTSTLKAGLFEGPLLGNVTGTVSSLANHTTDSLAEGTNNLYFSPARARSVFGATGDLQYDPTTGIFSYNEAVSSVNGLTGNVLLTTANVPESGTNLYLTDTNLQNALALRSVGDFADVNTVGIANGDILFWDATTSSFQPIPGDFEDNFVISASFDTTSGNLYHNRNDGNTVIANLDGRYLPLSGGTLVGPLFGTEATFGNVAVTDTLTANIGNFSGNVSVTDTLTAGTGDFGNVAVSDTLTAAYANVIALDSANVAVSGTLVADIGNFANVDVSDTLTANIGNFANVDVSGTLTAADVVTSGNVHVGGTLSAANVAIALDELSDVVTTAPTLNQVLSWNGVNWVNATVGSVNTFTWDSTTGNLAIQDTTGTFFDVNLDGRYAETVNGVVPDAAGNIVLNIAATSTGILAGIPAAASANNGDIYIVSGDAIANNNGETYIFDGANWQRVVSFDQAESDARYINTAGDAMTGTLTLAADPTVALEAATKQYVDGRTANVAINAISWDTATGNLVIQDGSGTDHPIDLDGRYLELTTGGNVTGTTIFSGILQAQTAPVSNFDVTNKVYVDAVVANSEVTVNTFTLDSATGNLSIEETNGNTHSLNLYTGGLDARYVNVNGDTMTGTLNGTNAVFTQNIQANTSTFANTTVTDTLTADTAAINGNLTSNTATFANATVTDTLTAADITTSGNVHVGGTLSAANVAIELGDLADVSNATPTTSDMLAWNGATWVPQAPAAAAFDWQSGAAGGVPAKTTKADNTTAIAEGDMFWDTTGNKLYTYDAGGSAWVVVSGDDIKVASVTLDATGNLVITDTAAATFDVNLYTGGLDARFVNVAGDTMTGTLNGTNAVFSQDVTSNTATFANATVTDTLTANIGNFSGDVVAAANLEVQGTLLANNVGFGLGDLADANVASAANGEVLYYDSTANEWKPKEDVHVSAAAFTKTTGNVTITMSDTSTHVFSLDGRYPETVNGIVPDAAGNIAVSLTATSTGAIASRPATANDGLIYVVSGDTNTSLNGDTYIWVGNTTVGTWEEIAPSDVAGNDARYVNVSGDTMTGQFTLAAGQTFASDDDAASVGYVKDYVGNTSLNDLADANTAGAANGNILYWDQTEGAWKATAGDTFNSYTNAAAFNTATGVVTQTRNDGNTYTVNLDGRYVVGANGTVTGQVLTWNGSAWVATAPAAAQFDWQSGAGVPATTTKADNTTALGEGDMFWDTTGNQLYSYDAGTSAWVAVGSTPFDNYIASATIVANNTTFTANLAYSNTSVADLQLNLAHSITSHSDVDTLTNPPVTNSSLLGWNGTNWVPVVSLDASSGAANDF